MLVNCYERVIVGSYVADNVKKGRKLPRTVNRLDRVWSHRPFKNCLINMAFDQNQVMVQEESWTSKTCTQCGSINKNLGGNKQFVCPACGLDIGRDVNGAMNILKKFLYF